MRWASTLMQLYKLKKRLAAQKAFNQQWLVPFLKELEAKHKGAFTQKQLKKIKEYYALFVPVMFCQPYRLLTGKPLTTEERKRATMLSIITPLYDDFFDEAEAGINRITELTLTPQIVSPATFEEKVFLQLHCWLLHQLPAENNYLECFKKVLQSQTQSLKQLNATISGEELFHITYQKSIDALRLCWAMLEPLPDWFDGTMPEAAGLIQLANDLFDVYKDAHAGQYTPANHNTDFDALTSRFINEAKAFNQKLSQLSYNKEAKQSFQFHIHAVVAGGVVALQQLKKVWLKQGRQWRPSQLPREALICDMQKPANFLRWLWYTYKFCNF